MSSQEVVHASEEMPKEIFVVRKTRAVVTDPRLIGTFFRNNDDGAKYVRVDKE